MSDVDPEGFLRGGAECICGPLYSYGGHVEPGQYHPDCREHADFQFANSFIRNENSKGLNTR